MILHPCFTHWAFLDHTNILVSNLLTCRSLINGNEHLAKEKNGKMEALRRMASQKWLAPNQRVSGVAGDLIEGGPKKRRQ
jgi:hypothetical protein